jgi:hypothetical protein
MTIKGKLIPITNHGGPKDREVSKFPHSLDTQLIDGSEVVKLVRQPAALHHKILILIYVRG